MDEIRVPDVLGRLEHLPALLPLRTHEATRPLASVTAAAVELSLLEGTIRKPSSMLRGVMPTSTTLVAVLNAADAKLETLWKKGPEKRVAMFRQLKTAGFVACTGPTFSVYHDTTVRLPCHNEISLRRHHTVLQEIADAGLVPIPNLYTTGRRGRESLVAWLRDQSQLNLVSRDFTMSRNRKPFDEEFRDLCEVLRQVERPLRVLIPGVARGRAACVIKRLADLGHSASLVTSNPVMKGLHGRSFTARADGSLVARSDPGNKGTIIERNVDIELEYCERLRARSGVGPTCIAGQHLRRRRLSTRGRSVSTRTRKHSQQ